jgi:hypothetical protein
MKFKFELEEHGITHTMEGDLGEWTAYVDVVQNFANLISGAYGYTIHLDPHTDSGKPLTEDELWEEYSEEEEKPVKNNKKCKAKCE